MDKNTIETKVTEYLNSIGVVETHDDGFKNNDGSTIDLRNILEDFADELLSSPPPQGIEELKLEFKNELKNYFYDDVEEKPAFTLKEVTNNIFKIFLPHLSNDAEVKELSAEIEKLLDQRNDLVNSEIPKYLAEISELKSKLADVPKVSESKLELSDEILEEAKEKFKKDTIKAENEFWGTREIWHINKLPTDEEIASKYREILINGHFIPNWKDGAMWMRDKVDGNTNVHAIKHWTKTPKMPEEYANLEVSEVIKQLRQIVYNDLDILNEWDEDIIGIACNKLYAKIDELQQGLQHREDTAVGFLEWYSSYGYSFDDYPEDKSDTSGLYSKDGENWFTPEELVKDYLTSIKGK